MYREPNIGNRTNCILRSGESLKIQKMWHYVFLHMTKKIWIRIEEAFFAYTVTPPPRSSWLRLCCRHWKICTVISLQQQVQLCFALMQDSLEKQHRNIGNKVCKQEGWAKGWLCKLTWPVKNMFLLARTHSRLKVLFAYCLNTNRL